MPTFDTPEPLSALVEFDMGTARFTATKRLDTVVTVTPTDERESADVKAAEQVEISCVDGRLTVKGPKQRSVFGKSGSVEVTVELPSGSDVRGTTAAGAFWTQGRLGDCRFESSAGDIHVAETGAAFLKTGFGAVRLQRATGDVVVEAAGQVDLGDITGTATVRNHQNDTSIGEITGDLRATTANGNIYVGVAHAAVDAKADNGSIKLGDVARGRVTMEAAIGDLEVGIRDSSVAWLEANSQFGAVRNALGSAAGPAPGAETVEISARTGYGDIVVRAASV
ncbi:DUF4097 family beta strand repeat-containing protein [Streptomyces sp. NRRL B-1347]|uniref:DUF4097 family beta strand repeat-containing protein n=1 Tax=Streptomyces sp. NRRL B-1347 TaxID=1476877 RepID=UPI0004C4D238|nr:DUF4097 family beta strand repeat-containing protein [Streptomyces sp. NRRL B-1347]